MWLVLLDLSCYLFALGGILSAFGWLGDTTGPTLPLCAVAAWILVPAAVELVWPKGRCHRRRPPDDRGKHPLPIIYSDHYNITAGGIESLHPFDSKKYGRIVKLLAPGILRGPDDCITPNPTTLAELHDWHAAGYLASLYLSAKAALIAEVPPLALLPSWAVRWRLLEPMQHQTGGSLDACEVALQRGWAINLGGGFHHASAGGGGGFCVYADIGLMIQYLRRFHPAAARRVAIIDLDAHQGNGHERDWGHDSNVLILDQYDPSNYPGDQEAKAGIGVDVPVTSEDTSTRHIALLRSRILPALTEFEPTFIVYNAGSDSLVGDPLGGLRLTPKALVRRDEMVFRAALSGGSAPVPIAMLLSGGYQPTTAAAIAASVENLCKEGGVARRHLRDMPAS